MTPTQLFKCLSDETRLHATLLVFLEQELCVCELTEALQISQPKLSRHLAQLRTYGVLNDIRRGQWVYYSISPKLPEWAKTVISNCCESQIPQLDVFQSRLKGMQNRPQCA